MIQRFGQSLVGILVNKRQVTPALAPSPVFMYVVETKKERVEIDGRQLMKLVIRIVISDIHPVDHIGYVVPYASCELRLALLKVQQLVHLSKNPLILISIIGEGEAQRVKATKVRASLAPVFGRYVNKTDVPGRGLPNAVVQVLMDDLLETLDSL